MEASIRDSNIKHFVRLLQCASRYGDDLCMWAKADYWELAVTNSSKSAYCLFTLAPGFFSRYKPLGNKTERKNGVKCQLYVKSVLNVLGKASAVNAVDRVDLKIVDPEGGLRAREDREGESSEEDDDIHLASRSAYLELKLVYRHGVTKKHKLHLQSSDCLRAEVDTDSTPSGFLISAKVLRDWLDHFTIAFGSGSSGNVRGDSQLAWMFAADEVRVKNFEAATTNTLSTEIKIDVNEFQDYGIEGERVDLALPMREFKATLQLAEQFGMTLDFAFSEASQPLTMTSRFDGLDRYGNEAKIFDIFCALATITTDAFPASLGTDSVANGSRRQRSTSIAVKSDTGSSKRHRSESVQKGSVLAGTSRPGSARPRPSLSLTARPTPRANPTFTISGGLGVLSQAGGADEPLFQPGPSQSSQGVRMTQQEVLELAGMGDLDMDAFMDDDEDDDDMAVSKVSTLGEPDIPSWEEISADFNNISPQGMSTQRDAIASAQCRGVSSRKRSLSPIKTTAAPVEKPLAHDTPQQPDVTMDTIKRSESTTEFQANPEILGVATTDRRDRRAASNGTEVYGDDVDELDADPMDATQPSGIKFQQFFDD